MKGWARLGWAGLLALCFVNINMSASSCIPSGGGGGGDNAVAIPAPWTATFDSSNPLSGWMYWNGNTSGAPSSSNATLWAVDATPTDMPGGASYSGTKSLNYNNGVNYNSPGVKLGGAVTPKIDISSMQVPVLKWRCNYETETAGTVTDQRWVKVGYWAGSSASYWVEQILSTNGNPAYGGPCATMGAWHEHVLSLQPGWGSIRVVFIFDSVDSTNNNYRGWFVDDIRIQESSIGGGTSGGGYPSGGGGYPSGGGGTASGGSTIFSTNFDSSASTNAWQLSSTFGNNVGWHFDGDPVGAPGGAAYSGSSSLNYNNGTDYKTVDTTGAVTQNFGSAQSPSISLSGYTSATLTFKCNSDTDSTGTNWDKRFVQIANNLGVTAEEYQLAQTGGATAPGACAAQGTWHNHTLNLQPSLGTIYVRFWFDTVDGVSNDHTGWFVDDVVVQGISPTTTGGGSTSGGGYPSGGGSGGSTSGGGYGGSTSGGGYGGSTSGGGYGGSTSGGGYGGSTSGGGYGVPTSSGGGTTSGSGAYGGTYGGTGTIPPSGSLTFFNFDNTGSLGGWELSPAVSGVGWGFDGTPTGVAGGSATSSPNSLNYNNGTTFATGTSPNSGYAQTPGFDLAAFSNPALTFKCNYQTETTGTQFDKRTVRVSNNNFGSAVLEEQLATSGGSSAAGSCASMGTWHSHTIPLQSSWGIVKVRFVFDTVDNKSNDFSGWFIDDLSIAPGGSGVSASPSTGTAVAGDRSEIFKDPAGSKKKKGGCYAGPGDDASGFGAIWMTLMAILLLRVAPRGRTT